VRELQRVLGKVYRAAAVERARGGGDAVIHIDVDNLPKYLGRQRFFDEESEVTRRPGIARGLAWTPVGGSVLYVEASTFPGHGGALVLTGQLGDVMKESAQAAWSLLKARAAGLWIDLDLFAHNDVHVHVPAGATPKDGPSAGVAMFMAMMSLMTERAVPPTTAMTGEISLRGLVLPVGGIREKVIAAARAGIDTVMLPARNRRDFDDIPLSARDRLKFVWLETVDDAVAATIGTRMSPAH